MAHSIIIITTAIMAAAFMFISGEMEVTGVAMAETGEVMEEIGVVTVAIGVETIE